MSFSDTFSPVNVAAERDELGKERDFITEGVGSLTPTPVQAAPAPIAEAPVMEEEEAIPAPSFSDQFAPAIEEVPSFSDQFSSQGAQAPITSQSPLDSVKAQFPNWPNLNAEEGAEFSQLSREAFKKDEEDTTLSEFQSLVSGTVKPGGYSPEDIAVNDELYSIAYDFVEDRYGLQSIEGESREEIVEKFLFNRRSVAMSGNSVRVLNETEYLMDAKNNPESLAKAARAYAMYENMAGITSDETSWAELGWATADVLQSVILDPINLVGAGLGKAAGGVSLKSGVKSLEKFIMKEAQEQMARGVSREAVQANAKGVVRTAAANAAKEGSAEVTEFAMSMAATTGGRRILTRAGMSEVAATTFVDAVAGSGAEFLYQQQLVDTGVQDEVNPYSVGLAALGGLAMGGIAARRVVTRGRSDTALVSEVVGQGDVRAVASGVRESMKGFFQNNVDKGSSWTAKSSGTELNVQDTEFFIELLNGLVDETGEVKFKGLAQSMQDEGFYYIPRDEDDKITNWIADFIETMDKDDVQGIVSDFEDLTGIKLEGLRDITIDGVTKTLDEVTPASFAQGFATKVRNTARTLNSVSQAARTMSPDIKMTPDEFMKEALDLGLMSSGKKATEGKAMKAIAAGQNRFIRALVSHPSTSLLNVLGYGVSSGMGTINDVVRGVIGLGTGTLQEILGNSVKGASKKRTSMALLQANANRIKLLLDPDMTSAAFKSALQRNSGALNRLNNIQGGGVDVTISVDEILGRSRVGQATENYIDAAQTATFVHAQDTFTKSQEYLFQMDKALRVLYGKSWNEFYNQPKVGAIMASKAYKALEEGAVAKVMEHTFSKSYKGEGLVGKVAGVLEDVRNIPGLGMMIPFGRFFNNTIDFTLKNTPIMNQVLKSVGNKYPDKTHGELLVQGAVAGGIIYSMTRNEQDKRRQGLGMYDSVDPSTGEIVSQQYDYPLSLFIAVGRLMSYYEEGEEVPLEVVEQLGKDFGGGGLTRNLSDTWSVAVDSVVALAQGEISKSGGLAMDTISGVGSQAISGFTRSFEPIDTLVGITMGTEMRPQNVKDGNAFIGKALSYIDNITQVVTGKPLNDAQVSSAEGERDPQLTKQGGIRVVRPTPALRLMNLLAYNSWENNESFLASKLVPAAANESHRMINEEINRAAAELMGSPEFRRRSQVQQRQLWEEQVGNIRDLARSRLAYEYTGAQSTFADQLGLTDKYTETQLIDGMRDLGFNDGIGDLSHEEILILRTALDAQGTIDALDLHRKRN